MRTQEPIRKGPSEQRLEMGLESHNLGPESPQLAFESSVRRGRDGNPSSARDNQPLPRTSGSGFRTQSRVGRETNLTAVKGTDTEVHTARIRHLHPHIRICTCAAVHADIDIPHIDTCVGIHILMGICSHI